jgi:hypothetical protein
VSDGRPRGGEDDGLAAPRGEHTRQRVRFGIIGAAGHLEQSSQRGTRVGGRWTGRSGDEQREKGELQVVFFTAGENPLKVSRRQSAPVPVQVAREIAVCLLPQQAAPQRGDARRQAAQQHQPQQRIRPSGSADRANPVDERTQDRGRSGRDADDRHGGAVGELHPYAPHSIGRRHRPT